MTVVLGFRDQGRAWIGWDSACTMGDLVTLVSGKVRHMSEYSVGVAGNAAALGILATAKLKDGHVRSYEDVLKKVSKPLHKRSACGDEDPDETEFIALVVSPHGIWYVTTKSAMEVMEPYGAIGTGTDTVLAAMDALTYVDDSPTVLEIALGIACNRSSTCSGPISMALVGGK